MEMKHQDGYAPSAEDTAKLNEIMTWLDDNGYKGIVLIHKGDIGVSWMNETDAEAIRHDFINALGHIADDSEDLAVALVHGMSMAVGQIFSMK